MHVQTPPSVPSVTKIQFESGGENRYNSPKARENGNAALQSTIAGVAKRFVFDGLEAALGRKKREDYPRKITGEVEALLCAIPCSAAPEGRSHWTMQMLADELVRLGVVESTSVQPSNSRCLHRQNEQTACQISAKPL